MGPLLKNRVLCHEFRMQLEEAAGAVPAAVQFSDLVKDMPAALREHTAGCAECRAAAQSLLETRALLADVPSHAALGGPWFSARVMAAIAASRPQGVRTADTWTFLPKLAARLTWASAIALLLASGWLYQKPASVPATSAKHIATDLTGEPVRDTTMPANNDEVLVSLAENQR